MQVLGIQLNSVWEDKEANHAKVREILAKAAPVPGAMVVLPEMFATGFSMNVAGIAEGEARPTERFLAEMAQEHGVTILGGVVNTALDERGLNQAVAFGPDGTEAVRYIKMHPFSYGGETKHYASGERPVLFAWGEFTVAPFVCYDLRFPEAFRSAARQGANLYTVGACWPQPRESHWITLLQARAIENQAYVIGVNRCGPDPQLYYSGRSLIIDPRGVILADAGNEEGVIQATLDLNALRDYRARFPALADIHPDYVPVQSG